MYAAFPYRVGLDHALFVSGLLPTSHAIEEERVKIEGSCGVYIDRVSSDLTCRC